MKVSIYLGSRLNKYLITHVILQIAKEFLENFSADLPWDR